jgi:hypothetical protein
MTVAHDQEGNSTQKNGEEDGGEIAPHLKKWLDQLKTDTWLQRIIFNSWYKIFRIQREERTHISRKWEVIGEEVYSRKTLFSASAELKRKGLRNPLKLAATDVFVEKAQLLLGKRARLFVFLGTILSLIAVAVLVVAAHVIYSRDIKDLFGGLPIDGFTISIVLLKVSSVGGFIVAAVAFLMRLSRSFLHEGTALYRGRHALRFGRLYVYLKEGDATLKELEKAFMWNAEFKTAFTSIKVDAKSPVQTITDGSTKFFETGTNFLKHFLKKDKGKA